MSTTANQSTPNVKIRQAREQLDAHTREIVAWHFHPDTGTPFWLEKAKSFRFNPLKEVKGFEDLKLFGLFEDDWLRGGPVRRWVPKALQNKPIFVFETGGTTGIPKSRVLIEDFRIDYEMFSDTLPEKYFPKGSNWLMLGPSGPRRLRLAVEHLCQYRGGTTPKLLDALAARLEKDGSSLAQTGITGVFCGGTEMTSQWIRFAIEEILGPNIYIAPTYGNTLMGLAAAEMPAASDNFKISYYAPQPRAVVQVVDFDNPDNVVEYGQSGRVMLTTLTKEFFVPRFLERDEGEREPPSAKYPWDGVSGVKPFRAIAAATTVGVY